MRKAWIVVFLVASVASGTIWYLWRPTGSEAKTTSIGSSDGGRLPREKDSSSQVSLLQKDDQKPATAPLHQQTVQVSLSNAPLPPINASLSSIFPDLKRRAEAGDRRAACRLGVELDRCEGIRRYKEKIPAHLQVAVPVCESFPLDDSNRSWPFILQAALAGDSYSAVRFSQGAGLTNGVSPSDNADGWIAYRQNVLPLLDSALENGSPQAAFMLARLSSRPMFDRSLPLQPVRALGYYIALRNVSKPEFQQDIDRLMDGITKQNSLTPAQLAEAQTFGNTVLTKLKKTPPNSVDFATGTFELNDGTECTP